eukprot:794280-Pyramimonas_sp.AAC.1
MAPAPAAAPAADVDMAPAPPGPGDGNLQEEIEGRCCSRSATAGARLTWWRCSARTSSMALRRSSG